MAAILQSAIRSSKFRETLWPCLGSWHNPKAKAKHRKAKAKPPAPAAELVEDVQAEPPAPAAELVEDVQGLYASMLTRYKVPAGCSSKEVSKIRHRAHSFLWHKEFSRCEGIGMRNEDPSKTASDPVTLDGSPRPDLLLLGNNTRRRM